MANPRRSSLHTPSDSNTATLHPSASLRLFIKRPYALPFLLSLLLLLAWLSLRPHRPPPAFHAPLDAQADAAANLARFSATAAPSEIASDSRGWLLDPVATARKAGINGGAQTCASVHVGEIRPGGVRGNHRHHTCNETFIIWGAKTKYRLENAQVENKGYAEVIIGVDEVAIAASPSGHAHALINIDNERPTFFLGCQDSLIDHNSSSNDFRVWKDL